MKILELLTPKRIIGNVGERAAARYLRKRGYKILERNYVYGGHEIDIIARRGNITAFIEVKTRTIGHENPKESRPAAAVTKEKMRRVIDTAHGYMFENGCPTRKRLDIIEVYLSEQKRVKEIKHLEGAYTKDTAGSGKRS